ncbi:MAG: hypothetical protein C4B58_05265 [Deltaproteobacteria bacterium]|nr:MAG: hypothetical protein C4B58_05265 [Deltaproteobacteria bacterium]
MNLLSFKKRIERIARRIIGGNETPPLIFFDSQDKSKGSTDPGRSFMATVPGKVGGPQGLSLSRTKGEPEASFLRRCEKTHT